MRLITLNTWGGQITDPLLHFISTQKDHTDIFCFQEIFNGQAPTAETFPNAVVDIYSQIELNLPDFNGYFARAHNIGNAIFLKKNIKLYEEGNVFVFRWQDALEKGDNKTQGRNVQYIVIEDQNQPLLILNFHGLWNGNGKTDTPERIIQSHKVRELMNRFGYPMILCGDFNLLPDTQSIGILEKDMRNLIKEYNVTSTRTSFYKKEPKYADYILVSPQINVIDFQVLPDEVSDHAPLFLEFEMKS